MSRSICVIMVPLTLLCTQGMKWMPASIWSSMGSPLPWKYPCAAISTNRSRVWALGLQQQKGCRIVHGAVHFWKVLQLFQRVLSASLAVPWMEVPDNDSQLHVRAHTLTRVVCLFHLCSRTWRCAVLGRREAHCLSYALGFISVALSNTDLLTSISFGTSRAV